MQDAAGQQFHLLVLDGGDDLRSAKEIHLHELAHLVDYAPGFPALSGLRQWRQVIEEERKQIIRWAASIDRPRELLASALSYLWTNPQDRPRFLKLPRSVEFFRCHGLI